MSPVLAPVDRFEQCTRVRAVFDLLGSWLRRVLSAARPTFTGSVTAALLLGQCLCYWTRPGRCGSSRNARAGSGRPRPNGSQ